MSGDLKALKQVAALDSRIFELEERTEQIPKLMRQAEEQVERATQRRDARALELKGFRVKTELKEKDHQAAEQTVIKLREQIGHAKSNKEYQALQHEILSKEADNARLEDAVLAQMQKVDQQKEEVDALAREVKNTAAELEKKRVKLEKELEEIKAQIEKLKEQRAEPGKNVPSDIFAKYERLIARRGQTAMVAVVNGNCQGCFMTLRSETMAQLKKGNDLVFCHSCARILYLEE